MFFWRKKRRPTRDTKPTRVLVRQIAIGTASIMLVAAIGAGVWYGTRIEALTIDSVNISGGDTIPHETIRILVETQLAGSYFALVPHRFAWTYPEESIEATIREQDRVKDVRVNREETALSISFTEYEPDALWCGMAAETTCLFLDATGYAYASAPSLIGGSFVRYVDMIREPSEGTHAYDSAQSESFRAFADALAAQYGFSVVSIVQTAPREVLYRLAGGGELKVSQDLALEATLTNLATVLGSAEFAHLTNGSFSYIDLRYGNRVFVNEASAVPDMDMEEGKGEEDVEMETSEPDDAVE